MRTTQQLIAELGQAAAGHQQAAIAMVLPGNATMLVWPNDNANLEKLDSSFALGGVPLGLLALDRLEGRLTVTSWVYPEHDDWEEADDRMDQLVEEFLQNIEPRKGENAPTATIYLGHLSTPRWWARTELAS